MGESLQVFDLFVRGVGVGATTVLGLVLARGRAITSTRVAGALMCASLIAWLISESPMLRSLVGQPTPLVIAAFPVGGFFWCYLNSVFVDRPLSLIEWSPTIVLVGLGMIIVAGPDNDAGWIAYNSATGMLALHALFVVARGWNGDLLEGRRRLRGLVLGLGAAFALCSVVLGFMARAEPQGVWRDFLIGGPFGGLILSIVVIAYAALLLQTREEVLGTPIKASLLADPRVEAADRVLLDKLNDVMSREEWRKEGLTIGALAASLGEPEHRLRRLINRRLGHRNFAEFVNGYRIEAVKARLADPREASMTVATIAYDAGFRSLAPFHRAFRAATGSTPADWRRTQLAALSELERSSQF